MPKLKLTSDAVERLPYSEKGSYYVYDESVAGLAVRVYTGHKAWVLRYRGYHEIGPAEGFGGLAPRAAREKAEALRAQLKKQKIETPTVHRLFVDEARRVLDPGLFESILRTAQQQALLAGMTPGVAHQIAAFTVRDLYERMREVYRDTLANDTGRRNATRSWEIHVLDRRLGPPHVPAPVILGQVLVRDFRRDHAEALKRAMAEVPAAANSVLDRLQHAFNQAEIWGWRVQGTNPLLGLERYPTYPRERTFSDAEIPRLWAAIQAARKLRLHNETPLILAEVLLLTGARPGEILQARLEWLEIDREAGLGLLRLPKAKGDRAGRKRGRLIGLGSEALEAVARALALPRRDPGNPYLFEGQKLGQPYSYSSFRSVWRSLCDMAGIPDAPPYTARHTYVTEGEEAGVDLAGMKDLAGHSRIATTDAVYRKPRVRNLLRNARKMGEHLARLAKLNTVDEQVTEMLAAFTSPLPATPTEPQTGSNNPLVTCACGCGLALRKYDSQRRARKFLPGHNVRQKSR